MPQPWYHHREPAAMTKCLIIGDTSEHTLTQAQRLYASACLVNQTNFNQVIACRSGEFFSALGDLDFDQLKHLALSCDYVVLLNELPWIDARAYDQTKILCNHLSHFCTVQGFDPVAPPRFTTQSVVRQYSEPTIWSVGCSHTAGVGLVNPMTEVYGARFAQLVNMPWQNIAESGTSVWWSLDHILHADIDRDDIVVWGTTAAERTRIARSFESVDETMIGYLSPNMLNYFTDEQMYFNHFNMINLGVEYLRRRGIKFVLLSLIPNTNFLDIIESRLSSYQEWCPVPKWYSFDLGTDGMHSGPLGHEYVAKQIYNHVQLLGYV